MTKAELIDLLAEKNGLSKTVTREVLDTIIVQITEILKKEGRFALPGLGIFELAERPNRIARNPRTNEPAMIKAHKAIKFKAAKSLKEDIN